MSQLFEQECGEELGVEEGACKIRVLGWQLFEAQETLEPLEDQFDLPAEPIDIEDSLRGESSLGCRGENQNIAGQLKRLRLDRLAFAGRLLACAWSRSCAAEPIRCSAWTGARAGPCGAPRSTPAAPPQDCGPPL